MDGAEGSYLLETLTNFVGDQVANAPFERDLYVIAPCCEPAALAEHQPITIILIAVKDLALFESWAACRDVRVEHGSDGSRVLTLMELARRHRSEQVEIARRRAGGERSRWVETMYVLDLALDTRRTDPDPAGPVGPLRGRSQGSEPGVTPGVTPGERPSQRRMSGPRVSPWTRIENTTTT